MFLSENSGYSRILELLCRHKALVSTLKITGTGNESEQVMNKLDSVSSEPFIRGIVKIIDYFMGL